MGRSLRFRLEALKQTKIEAAEDSIRFVKELLEVARALVEADRAEVAETGAAAVEGEEPAEEVASRLPDQRRAAVTPIFVVMGIRFGGWQTSRDGDRKVKVAMRQVLKRLGTDPTRDIFDRRYAYVAAHY